MDIGGPGGTGSSSTGFAYKDSSTKATTNAGSSGTTIPI